MAWFETRLEIHACTDGRVVVVCLVRSEIMLERNPGAQGKEPTWKGMPGAVHVGGLLVC